MREWGRHLEDPAPPRGGQARGQAFPEGTTIWMGSVLVGEPQCQGTAQERDIQILVKSRTYWSATSRGSVWGGPCFHSMRYIPEHERRAKQMVATAKNPLPGNLGYRLTSDLTERMIGDVA